VLVIALGFGLPRVFTGVAPEPSQVEAKASEQKRESSAAAPAESQQSTSQLWMSLARMAIGLVIVCGLCIAVTRWMAGQKPPAGKAMEVLASLAVDARCGIHLVRAGERRLLIGTDFAGVKALVELPGRLPELGADAPAETPAESPAPGAAEPAVVLGPFTVPAPPPPPAAPAADELLALLSRLRSSTTVKPASGA
jgi:flagellar biogenesis protein FliO